MSPGRMLVSRLSARSGRRIPVGDGHDARRISGTSLEVLGWLTPAKARDEQMEQLAAQGTPVPRHPVQSTTTHNPKQCCTSN